MSATAAEQLRRLLALVPLLADGERHSFEEAAAVGGAPLNELIDDLRSLSERYDVPGGFVEGLQILHDHEGVSLVTPHFLRPMRLTMSELCALELGLALLIGELPPDETAAVRGAIDRLRKVIGRVPGYETTDGGVDASLFAPGVAPETLRDLRSSIQQRREVGLLYRSGSALEPIWRVVHPYALAFANGMWYVVGWSESETVIRPFRLDRIEAVEAHDAAFEIPRAFSVDAFLARDLPQMARQSAETLRVWYGGDAARWIAEREGRTVNEDGTLVVDRPLLDRAWAVRHVLQYGPAARVLEPGDVRDMVIERLRTLRTGLSEGTPTMDG